MSTATAVRTRLSIYELLEDEKATEKLIRAWHGIQHLPPDDPNSFFLLGGFHGEPFRGVGATDSSIWWGGFCEHATVLFPTWHRAYLYRLEKALQSIHGCEDVMMPFWDECSDRARAEGVPAIFTDPTVELDGVQIDNPLKSYVLQETITDNVAHDYPVYTKPKGYRTVRYPLSGLVGTPGDQAATAAHNAQFTDEARNTELLNANVKQWLTTTYLYPGEVDTSPAGVSGDDIDKFILSLGAPTYTLFSNKASQDAWNTAHPKDPPVYALENPHNNMHVALGGVEVPGYDRDRIDGAQGDMGENDTAALDPIFFFHHCFVDYVFWTWQRRNGATNWFDIDPDDVGATATSASQIAAGRAENELLSMDSALNPFRIGEGRESRPITSRDVIDIEELGYTYGDGSLDRFVEGAIPALEPGPVLHVSGVNRARIAGSFVIAAHAEIDGKKQLIGHEAILSRWHVSGCMNCQTHLEARAAIPLPRHVHDLARTAPEKITVSVHTRDGLHGGVPIPVGAAAEPGAGAAKPPFKVHLHH